jgi:hypothetical protein
VVTPAGFPVKRNQLEKVSLYYPGFNKNAGRQKKEKGPKGLSGPFLSSLFRYWCGAKPRAEFLAVAQAIQR